MCLAMTVGRFQVLIPGNNAVQCQNYDVLFTHQDIKYHELYCRLWQLQSYHIQRHWLHISHLSVCGLLFVSIYHSQSRYVTRYVKQSTKLKKYERKFYNKCKVECSPDCQVMWWPCWQSLSVTHEDSLSRVPASSPGSSSALSLWSVGFWWSFCDLKVISWIIRCEYKNGISAENIIDIGQ